MKITHAEIGPMPKSFLDPMPEVYHKKDVAYLQS